MKKWMMIGGGVLLLAILWALLSDGGIEVTTATAMRDTLSVTIPAEGRTRSRERFAVTAPVSGRLTRIDLESGDLVEEGQLLGRLYAAPEDPRVIATSRAEVEAAEARYREAQTMLRQAELQALQADREAERRRPLFELGAITAEQMEQAELAATVADQRRSSAEASVEAARAALEAARARLIGAGSTDPEASPVDIVAPVAGRVEQVPEESERVVLAGAPILTLADVGGLEVVLDILSEDAVRVRPGNDVVLTGWGGEEPLHGTVRTVTLVGYTKVSALGVEEQRVDVLADLNDPPEVLGTGYRVSGEIVTWHGEGVVTVPTSALFRSGEAWQAFVVEDGKARRRDVEIGRRNEERAEIVGGLEDGEVVILFPPEDVDDGVDVQPVDGA
ncbi:MAG: efflux RND transporter periplasmic adaptor subunit [Gemmatimonadota bacterium]|jgi:HlyD family secretion protein